MKKEWGSMLLFGALLWPGKRGKHRKIKNADPKILPRSTFSSVKWGYAYLSILVEIKYGHISERGV